MFLLLVRDYECACACYDCMSGGPLCQESHLRYTCGSAFPVPSAPPFAHTRIYLSSRRYHSPRSLCLVHTGKPTGRAVSHCITWFQTKVTLLEHLRGTCKPGKGTKVNAPAALASPSNCTSLLLCNPTRWCSVCALPLGATQADWPQPEPPLNKGCSVGASSSVSTGGALPRDPSGEHRREESAPKPKAYAMAARL